jgi:hypothetical protein
MSRSYRQPFIALVAAASEREDKKIWHGRMRAQERTRLASTRDLDSYLGVDVREVSNPYTMAKDGSVQIADGLVVRRQPRSLKIVRTPSWLRTPREVYKVLAK